MVRRAGSAGIAAPAAFGWRWRRNPLRRRSDVVEAWVRAVAALLLCAVPLAGWWAGQSVDRALKRVAREQRAERSLVRADFVHGGAGRGAAGAVALRWTAPDGSAHTGDVPVSLEVWRGGELRVWTDREGALVPPPLDAATAAPHAVVAGVATGAAAAGAVLASRRLLLWRLMRRRLARWEREWARVGQDWGRAGAGG
jgi:hypothetical protein